MNVPRPLSRGVLALALLLLGAVAAGRVPLSYLPDLSIPEISLGLSLAERSDPDLVARRWVVPLEAAVRSLGSVTGIAGEVEEDGAWLQVRFAPGVDPERKAARLDAELGRLRRRLSWDSWVSVWPSASRGGEVAAVLWLDTELDGEARRLADRLQRQPGIASVEIYGEAEEQLRVRLHRDVTPPVGEVRWAVERALGGEVLGQSHAAGAVRTAELEGSLESLPIEVGGALLPLARIATVSSKRIPPERLARVEGREGRLLVVRREHDASPLSVDRELAGWVRNTPGLRFARREAEPLRRLVASLLLGLGAAMVAGLLIGALLDGLGAAVMLAVLPALVVAVALNLLWLAGLSLDVTTLPALAVGVAVGLLLLALRLGGSGRRPGFWVGALASLVAVPMAMALAGGSLAPLLAAPTRVFVLAGAGGLALGGLLPRPESLARRSGASRRVRGLLRDPLTVLLVGITTLAVSLALFGPWLEPRSGELEARPEELVVKIDLREGSTLEDASREVQEVERKVARLPPVGHYWSFFDRTGGTLIAELDSEAREESGRRALLTRLRYALARGNAAYEIWLGGGSFSRGGSLRFDAGIEARAETDEDAYETRFVLRSTELEALRLLWPRVENRIARTKLRIESGWGAPAVRLELEPRPGVSPERARQLAELLVQRSVRPPRRVLPGEGERSLVVASALGPFDDEVPSRRELLDRPIVEGAGAVVPAALLRPVERTVYPAVDRESGRFVLPVSLLCFMESVPFCRREREKALRSLSAMSLPPAVGLELPDLSPWRFWREKWRMVAVAAVLPLLLLAVAVWRLGAIGLGVATLAAPATGLAFAAPLVAARGYLDELGLALLAMVLAGSFPLATEVARWVARGAERGGPGIYRALAARLPWVAWLSLPAWLMLVVPALGTGSQQIWAAALRVAGAAALGTGLGAGVLLPALVQGAVAWSERDPERERRRRRPPSWREPGPPRLTVQNLTKVFRGGFRALSAASFELEPGIVGLLGPNGAGKTTLLRLLTGLLEPTRGQVLFRGVPLAPENLATFRRELGFLPQDFNAYPGFTAEQFLDYWALERGLADPRERQQETQRLLELVQLSEHGQRKVRDFSGGMRRRMGIAQALIGSPPVLVVDEPTTGLDIEARQRLRAALRAVARERVVLFSTHIASDVEAVASRLLILLAGRLRFDGSVAELLERARGRVFEALVQETELRELGRHYRVTSRVRVRDGIRIRAVARPGEDPAGEPVSPSLEEAYLAETDRWIERAGSKGRLDFLGG